MRSGERWWREAPVPDAEWVPAHNSALRITEWRNGDGRTPSPLGASLEVRPSRYALEENMLVAVSQLESS